MPSVAVSQKSYTAYAQWRVANGRRSRERHAILSPRCRRHSIVQSSLCPSIIISSSAVLMSQLKKPSQRVTLLCPSRTLLFSKSMMCHDARYTWHSACDGN
ncbi:hypothetical protein FOFC_14862 [Fusarium oxysporum]|nr:hypothetical protein FOFC_14862 [Fusarium oxysporum]